MVPLRGVQEGLGLAIHVLPWAPPILQPVSTLNQLACENATAAVGAFYHKTGWLAASFSLAYDDCV